MCTCRCVRVPCVCKGCYALLFTSQRWLFMAWPMYEFHTHVTPDIFPSWSRQFLLTRWPLFSTQRLLLSARPHFPLEDERLYSLWFPPKIWFIVKIFSKTFFLWHKDRSLSCKWQFSKMTILQEKMVRSSRDSSCICPLTRFEEDCRVTLTEGIVTWHESQRFVTRWYTEHADVVIDSTKQHPDQSLAHCRRKLRWTDCGDELSQASPKVTNSRTICNSLWLQKKPAADQYVTQFGGGSYCVTHFGGDNHYVTQISGQSYLMSLTSVVKVAAYCVTHFHAERRLQCRQQINM